MVLVKLHRFLKILEHLYMWNIARLKSNMAGCGILSMLICKSILQICSLSNVMF